MSKENRKGEDILALIIDKAAARWQKLYDQMVDEMNVEIALCSHGKKVYVLTGGDVSASMTIAEARRVYENKYFKTANGDKPKFPAWMKHPNRRDIASWAAEQSITDLRYANDPDITECDFDFDDDDDLAS